MADTKISALTNGTTAEATDRIAVARDPTGTPLSRYITPAYINAYIVGLANTWTGANVFSPSGDVLEQYRSTNAQTYYIYNTRTDASNYERGHVRWSGNVFRFGTEALGTGTVRDVRFVRGGTGQLELTAAGVVLSTSLNGGNNNISGFNLDQASSTADGTDTIAGRLRTNRGASGTVTRTLQSSSIANLIFKRVESHAFRIKPPSGGRIRRMNGTLEAADKYIELASDGAGVHIAYDGANFICLWEVGTITVEP